MNDMTEQERDAATIVAEWRAELDTHDREAQDGDRTWHFTHYIRADPEAFIRAALSELDRLQADNARLRVAFTKMLDQYEAIARDWTLNAGVRSFADTEAQHVRAILDGAK